jgi:transcriptional regulator with XRE-family HTH domain
MSTTLAGLIKDLRMQKNLSQLEISLALGWKESSRLSRIEQGHIVKPNRKILDKLMDAMNLSPEERYRTYVVGNYLPTKKDILAARSQLTPLINSWPYPASAMDYTWRIICTNHHMYELFNLNTKDQKVIETNLPNLLELIFSPDIKNIQNDALLHIRLLAQFQHSQSTRTKERWYLDLVQRMMQNDYFRTLWLKAQKYQPENYDISQFATKSLKNFHFYACIMPVYNDSRFMVEYYFPADLKTHQHYT